MGSVKWRIILIAIVVIVALYYLYPTLKIISLSEDQKAAMPAEEYSDLRNRAIHLGLDLQGGMHVVLEIDKTAIDEGDLDNTMNKAETVIRNRIDKFGVAEPLIQKQGNDRLVVQLAGVKDEQRAKELLGRMALLEFRLLKEGDEFRQLIATIDESLHVEIRELTADLEAEEFERELEEAAMDSDTTGLRDEMESELSRGRSLLSMITFIPLGSGERVHENSMVVGKYSLAVKEILALADERGIIPPDVQVLWDYNVGEGRDDTFQYIYLSERKPQLTGKHIKSASVTFGLDPDYPNMPGVRMEMNRVGRSLFAKATGENIGRRLAIVLDDNVHSAPNILEKIRSATASITGSFEPDAAKALAVVIEAGALPAPLIFAEERTVGPSLGRDSISAGVRAAIIGLVAVAIFMVIYYQLSGLLAILALVLNLIIVLAALGGMRGTLTLPGIAGIILTIGMAVDANVLIFERVREEIGLGKTVRRAIKDGYSRAFYTILDANVTTLIAAGVLYQFGTGPIRGFAVTLSIGILASMFTAIIVTRTVFDGITSVRSIGKLSI
jgi:protein-export membrane protein SecD